MYKIMADTDMNLRLGDIIEIIAPSDPVVNDKKYYINFIDNSTIELLQDNGDTHTLHIEPDKRLRNESITEIHILDRASELGYARQHQLLPNTWVNIYFGGDQPTVITGFREYCGSCMIMEMRLPRTSRISVSEH